MSKSIAELCGKGISSVYPATDLNDADKGEFLAVFVDHASPEILQKFTKQEEGPLISSCGMSVHYFMNQSSGEGLKITYSTENCQEKFELVKDTYKTLKQVVNKHADYLFTRHSNLNLIKPSYVKSVGWGATHTTYIQPTIVLFCHKKGILPHGEKQFPLTIEGIQTDIREETSSLTPTQIPVNHKVTNERHMTM